MSPKISEQAMCRFGLLPMVEDGRTEVHSKASPNSLENNVEVQKNSQTAIINVSSAPIKTTAQPLVRSIDALAAETNVAGQTYTNESDNESTLNPFVLLSFEEEVVNQQQEEKYDSDTKRAIQNKIATQTLPSPKLYWMRLV